MQNYFTKSHHPIWLKHVHLSSLTSFTAALAFLVIATARTAASSVELNVNIAPCGFGFSDWCAFSSDRGTIMAVYHIAPGTPDGGYPVTFTTHTGYAYEGFTAYVVNGVGSPTVIVPQTRGTELSYEGVELVTTDGASASLTRRDVYFGELGEPYPGILPNPEDKEAHLDVYINMPPLPQRPSQLQARRVINPMTLMTAERVLTTMATTRMSPVAEMTAETLMVWPATLSIWSRPACELLTRHWNTLRPRGRGLILL